MEHLRYTAVSGLKERQSIKFFSWVNALILILSVFILAYFLYPGQNILKTLIHEDYLSEVDFRYSVLLISKPILSDVSPEDLYKNPEKIIDQIQQICRTNQLMLSPVDFWLSYIILRSITLNDSLPSSIKHKGIAVMKEYFTHFDSQLNLNIGQLKVLARDSLAVESTSWAMIFFQRIIRLAPEQGIDFYGEAARTALWANQCEKSAKISFNGMRKAKTLNDKRYFFFLAIQSLFECNKYDLAMNMAKENLGELSNDVTTYQLLADYALKANKPKLANEWINKLLDIQGFRKTLKK